MSSPDLTVVIPTIGREQQCHASIASVGAVRRETRLDIELIVVEQGPAPAYRIPDGFTDRWLFSDRVGVAHARNIGLGLAAGTVVMFLDDDAVLLPHVVDLVDEFRRSGAAMVCGRMVHDDGTVSRDGDGRVIVHGHDAFLTFVETAALWDTAAVRGVGGFDERLGPPNRLGAEEGAQMLGRLHRAGAGPFVFLPVDLVRHPALAEAPPDKARRYGRGATGGLVLAPSWWLLRYVAMSGVRRVGGVLAAVARRDRDGARHRIAWLCGYVEGPIVGFRVRRQPRALSSDVIDRVGS